MTLKACAHLPPNLTLGFNAKVAGRTLVSNVDPKQGRLRRVSTWKSDAENRRGKKSIFSCMHWKHLTWIRSSSCCCSWRVSPAPAWPRQYPCPPAMVVPPPPSSPVTGRRWTSLGHSSPVTCLLLYQLALKWTFSPEEYFWKEMQRWQRPGDAGVRSTCQTGAQPSSLPAQPFSFPPSAQFSKKAYFFYSPFISFWASKITMFWQYLLTKTVSNEGLETGG